MMPAAVREPDLASPGVDRHRAGAEFQLDPALGVELGGAQRDPLLGCRAGEVILGQIGPIVRPRVVGAQHRDPAGTALPRSISAAAFPAAPPPMITIDSGPACAAVRAGRRAGSSF